MNFLICNIFLNILFSVSLLNAISTKDSNLGGNIEQEINQEPLFVRTAYSSSLSDPHRIWKIKENIEISHEYADRLHNTLKKMFPNLNFELIIMNGYEELGYSIEEHIPNNILIVRIDGTFESYNDFYLKLLNQL